MPKRSSRVGTRGDVQERGLPSTRDIGDRIKAAADAIGSRKEAARLAGVSDDMLYRYMRGETPPRFEAIVNLAGAAGFSLDWMATGQHAPMATREGAGVYDAEQTGWARQRMRAIEALLAQEPALPLAAERVDANVMLVTALADLRRIARMATVPQDLRATAACAAQEGFGDAELTRTPDADASEGQRSAQRVAEVADALEDAIREVGYRPPELILDGFKTAMYVNDMPRAAAVTLLQFLDAHERKQER